MHFTSPHFTSLFYLTIFQHQNDVISIVEPMVTVKVVNVSVKKAGTVTNVWLDYAILDVWNMDNVRMEPVSVQKDGMDDTVR